MSESLGSTPSSFMPPVHRRAPRDLPRAVDRVRARVRRARAARACARVTTVWSLLLLLALAAALAAPIHDRRDALAADDAARSTESIDAEAVQSVFLYHFASRHVKWPTSAFESKTSPFVIGVLGDDPMVRPLIEACRGRKSGDHPIHVRTLDEVDDAALCHILYLPAKRDGLLREVLNVCEGLPILIVGSSESIVRRGAHIGFMVEKSKVRFAIDPIGPKEAGLEVSSELLKLARVIERQIGGGGR